MQRQPPKIKVVKIQNVEIINVYVPNCTAWVLLSIPMADAC